MKPGPLTIVGGVDHGTMWQEIAICPEARPVGVAAALRNSFNETWLRLLVHHLELGICELCGDARCVGVGTDDACDYTRASGECICETCGAQYCDHPMAKDLPGCDGPFLHRLCDGALVKL